MYQTNKLPYCTQPADVTDHVIRKTYSDVMTALREEHSHAIGGAIAIEIDMPVRFARAILALKPSQVSVQVPISRKDLKALMDESGYGHVTAQEKADFIGGFRHAEAYHSIKPKEQA